MHFRDREGSKYWLTIFDTLYHEVATININLRNVTGESLLGVIDPSRIVFRRLDGQFSDRLDEEKRQKRFFVGGISFGDEDMDGVLHPGRENAIEVVIHFETTPETAGAVSTVYRPNITTNSTPQLSPSDEESEPSSSTEDNLEPLLAVSGITSFRWQLQTALIIICIITLSVGLYMNLVNFHKIKSLLERIDSESDDDSPK